jgi:hypothetical protein
LKVDAPLNILAMLVTDTTFHLLRSSLNAVLPMNNEAMVVTKVVFQSEISPYFAVAVVGFAIQVDTAKTMFVSAMGACASTTGNRVQLSSSTAPRSKQQSTLRRKASRGHHVDGRTWEEEGTSPSCMLRLANQGLCYSASYRVSNKADVQGCFKIT